MQETLSLENVKSIFEVASQAGSDEWDDLLVKHLLQASLHLYYEVIFL